MGQRLTNSGIIGLPQTRAKATGLSSLPVELHDLVFQGLGVRDVLYLSLTSRRFWMVGQRHLQNFSVSLLEPWAGESIICIGDLLHRGAVLPEVLTAAEEEVVRRAIGKVYQGSW